MGVLRSLFRRVNIYLTVLESPYIGDLFGCHFVLKPVVPLFLYLHILFFLAHSCTFVRGQAMEYRYSIFLGQINA